MITLNFPPSYLLHCIVNALVSYPLSYLAKDQPKYQQPCSVGASYFSYNTRGSFFMPSTVRMPSTVPASGPVHIDGSHPSRNVCAT